MNKTNRWWEGYIVRYAVGTVVGAMCVYFILDMLGGEAKALWLMQPNITNDHIIALNETCKTLNSQACIVQAQLTQDLYGFNFVQLVLLGIYGLAFNYLASAPVLVLHAVRRVFMTKNACNKEYSQCSKILPSCLVAVFLIGLTFIGFGFCMPWVHGWLNELLLILAGVYLLLQLGLLCWEYSNSKSLLRYYKQLHRARTSGCIDADSYKHLREHGNAFLLVLHNVMLLGVIFAIIQSFGDQWIPLAILWIIPAAGVYMLGHKIEAEMASDRMCK